MKTHHWLGVVLIVVACLSIIGILNVAQDRLLVSTEEYIRTATSTTPAPGIEGGSVSFIAVGDIMLGRYVETLMNTYGQDYPFASIDSFLKNADAVVGNLEGPITIPHIQTKNGAFNFSFDQSVGPLLKKHNIGIVSIANNHTYDYGDKGYVTTSSVLDKSGIQHFGHPATTSAAYVLSTTIKNQPITLIGFNATVSSFNESEAIRLVKEFPRREGEIRIVQVHGGIEYDLKSNSEQQILYRTFIDNGATMIISHHPHVVQEIEQYKGKLIFYSLGNFIFDQYFSDDVKQGLALKLTIDQKNISVDLVPLQSSMSQPREMVGDEKTNFLSKLAQKSSVQLSGMINQGVIKIFR